MSGLVNVFIIERAHLDAIVSENWRKSTTNEKIFYGMPRKFSFMMNLIVVKDIEAGTFTVVKNRWPSPKDDLVMPLEIFDSWFLKIQETVREYERNYSASKPTRL